MESTLERFCRYVQIDTAAREGVTNYPSSAGQLELGRLLADELRALGVADVEQTSHGLVYATIPATSGYENVETIAFVAHVDTSPENSGAGVRPIVHHRYQGHDLVLPGDPTKVLKVSENPELEKMIGRTLVTSDGTTLLGADDKAGVTAIMSAVARWLQPNAPAHGRVKILFTCDEEIGHGVDHVDLKHLGAVVGYTLDGSGAGEIDVETFSADLATITIHGRNIHPSIGKGRLVNAIRIAADLISRLPWETLSPETTCGREGFLHPYRIEGGVGDATIRILLRDFDEQGLESKRALLKTTVEKLQEIHPGATLDLQVTAQYRNMAEGLKREPRAVEYAQIAMTRMGLSPSLESVRGGTDGSRLTAMGLPTPNLSTGEHNPHSLLEWTCIEEIETAAKSILEIASIWAERTT
jgi:tripeptide aminopeptidase